jgi:hypothetical protein
MGFPDKIISRHQDNFPTVPLLLNLYSTWKLYPKMSNLNVNYSIQKSEGVRMGWPCYYCYCGPQLAALGQISPMPHQRHGIKGGTGGRGIEVNPLSIGPSKGSQDPLPMMKRTDQEAIIFK